MHRRSILQLSGALTIVAAIAVTGILLHNKPIRLRPRLAIPRKATLPVAASPSSLYTQYPVVVPRSAMTTPLLRKEYALIRYCPVWQQQDWIRAHYPNIYWAPTDGIYYFTFPGTEVTLLPVLWGTPPLWIGHPITP